MGLEDLPEPQGTVSGDHHRLPPRLDLAEKVARGRELVLRGALQPARHGAVARVVQLVAPRVERGEQHPAGRVPERIGDQIEARDRDHRDPQGLRHHLRRRDPHPQAREHPRPDGNGDRRQLAQREIGRPEQMFDGRRELLGVARWPVDSRTAQLERRDHTQLRPERDADAARRGVDREEQHVSRPGARS